MTDSTSTGMWAAQHQLIVEILSTAPDRRLPISELAREMDKQGVASVEDFGGLEHFIEAMSEELCRAF